MNNSFEEILTTNNRESNFSKTMDSSNNLDNSFVLDNELFYRESIKPSIDRHLEELFKEDKNDYMDADEYYILQYINQIESFIAEYGYDREICTISENSSIEDIEKSIRLFLVDKANAWNHLELLGELINLPNKVYICCYEPYGEEVIYIENRNNKLFFFNTVDKGMFLNDNNINYLDNNYEIKSDLELLF